MSTLAPQRSPSAHSIGAAQLVAWGATFYAIPPLLPRIGHHLSVSTSALSVAMTVGLVLNAFASLAVAGWIHRRGARVPMTLGSVVASCALVLLASSTTPATASIAIALLGGAQAALLYEPAFAAVSMQSADPVSRTRAIEIITFWGGWAALWALPTASFLGGWLGWRITLIVLALLLAGHTIRVHAKLPPPVFRRSAASASTGPAVSIGLAAAFALGSFATTAVVVNGLLLLADRKVSVETASIVFALLAPLQVSGRVWFMRRKGRLARHDGSLPFVLVAGGIIALLAAPHWLPLAVFVMLFGSGTGLLTTIRAAVVVLHVPPEHVARHLGVYSFVTSVARAVAPAVSASLHLGLGYGVSLLVVAAMAVIAGGLVWRATSCACAEVPRARCSSWLTNGGLSCAHNQSARAAA
jgi:MFS family permease